MNVLIPYDITTTGMNNPYLFLLLRELVKQKQIKNITTGYGWLEENLKPDIIHLHWPELLVKSYLPDRSRVDLLTPTHFSRVIDALKSYKKKGAKIVTTIHNERPHKDSEGQFYNFYSNVYHLSDGFIHMGKISEELMKKQFDGETIDKLSFTIPHGNYDYFPDDLTREHCRSLLHIHPQHKLILAFGAIRTEAELNLGLNAFLEANVDHSVYLMAGKLPYPYKSQWKHFKARRKLYRHYFNKRIRITEQVISPEGVQIYLKASDLILIPRINTLNSGNVALGFTFGKVVVGPNYGVIGELLNETGNPVFNPDHIGDVAASIKKGIKYSDEGLGDRNRKYATENMKWDQIAEKTVQSYKLILARQD